MKLILFSGDHPRHLFVNKDVPKYFDEALIIIMRREELLPNPPKNLSTHDKNLFKTHFENRYKVEAATYGDLSPSDVYHNFNTIFVNPHELNTHKIAKVVKDFRADFCFIFGVDLILDPVILELPAVKVNLHLGLSPWYKGGATLFWPFYHLQPQFCGVTFHQITKQADAGEIIHQCTPELLKGDKIHDVAAKCVVKAKKDLRKILTYWKKKRKFNGKIQHTSGRNWRNIDFHASQLRVIYDLFDDNIVDSYLCGQLDDRKVKLFSCIE